jgi:hypothetical protein
MQRSPEPKTAPTLQALPRELIKLICTHLYDPLHLTQQDRLSALSAAASDPTPLADPLQHGASFQPLIWTLIGRLHLNH